MRHKFRVLIALETEKLNEESCELLKRYYDVRIAKDAEDVYRYIHDFKPGLAVLDYNLARVNPIELHEGVEFLHPETKVVICVTEENLKVAKCVWCQRAIDYIRKPVDKNRIMDDINKIVRHIIDQREIKELQDGIKDLEDENVKLKNLL